MSANLYRLFHTNKLFNKMFLFIQIIQILESLVHFPWKKFEYLYLPQLALLSLFCIILISHLDDRPSKYLPKEKKYYSS